MKKIALTLAAVMVSGAVLTACSSNSSTTEPESSISTTQTEDGVHLTVQVGPDPETIDPALNATSDAGNMIIHAFETLLSYDKNRNLVPAQAESFEVSEDGLTYTFKIREGLTWSDGSPLTAHDFVYSWKRLANPETAAPYAYSSLGMLKGFDQAENGDVEALGVSAPDDYTFVVELAAPCVYFDKVVTHTTTAPVQQSVVEANGDQWTLQPETYIGNGPMKMSEWVPGSHITFVKNENYWNKGEVTTDSLKFVLTADPNAAYNAYRAGELDLIKDVPTQEIATLQSTPDFRLDPLMGTYYLNINTQKEPFNNPDVRMALNLAIDRKYIAETIMQGTYLTATNFVGPGISDVETGTSFEEVSRERNGGNDFFDVENYEANVEKAKELLEKAGYKDGEGFPTIEYMTNDAGYHIPVAEYLQSAYKELGINMDIKVLEWSTFSATRRQGDFDMARNGWVCDFDNPANMLTLFNSHNGNNDGKYNNPEFDQLMAEANSTPDVEKHYELLHQAESMILEDAAMIPIAYYTDFYLQKPELNGVWHSPNGYWYFMYASR